MHKMFSKFPQRNSLSCCMHLFPRWDVCQFLVAQYLSYGLAAVVPCTATIISLVPSLPDLFQHARKEGEPGKRNHMCGG